MNDTSPEVERAYRAMLLRRSGEERLKMGCSMYATARALVMASLLEKDPLASPTALRRALFLRLYGEEFDEETRGKILFALERHENAGGSTTDRNVRTPRPEMGPGGSGRPEPIVPRPGRKGCSPCG